MSTESILTISITGPAAATTQPGFGEPLILATRAGVKTTFTERVRFYTALADVLTDFAATDAEYLDAQAVFAQSPRVTRLAIGRRALLPTQQWKLSVASVAATTYPLTVGTTDLDVAVAGTFATNDAIVTAIVGAITSLAPAGYTASAQGTLGSKYVQILASTPGTFLNVATRDPALLTVQQVHADPGLATDLAAIALEYNGFYGIVSTTNSKAEIAAIAAWTEANKKLFLAATNDTTVITTALNVADDPAEDAFDAAYDRTAILYHHRPSQFADGAWAGKCLPYTPGSETWMFKALAGVEASTLTGTHQANLDAKNANYYTQWQGVNITVGGKVSSGKFIDAIRGCDWLEADLKTELALLFAGTAKVPYTDAGIASVEARVRQSLARGVANGFIAPGTITVTFPKAKDVSAADKAARRLSGSFTAQGAGALHGITVNGNITL